MGETLAALSGDAEKRLLLVLLTHGRQALDSLPGLAEGISPEQAREAARRLQGAGLVQIDASGVTLTERGQKRVIYGSTNLEQLVGTYVGGGSAANARKPLSLKYRVVAVLGAGATSTTFRATEVSTHRDRALKVFLPGTVSYSKLDGALHKRRRLPEGLGIPDVLEAGELAIELVDGTVRPVPAVVMSLVEDAETLEDFLRAKANVPVRFYELFVERVATALAAIEKAGLQHGDLHEGNILVLKIPGGGYDFRVVDFIGVPSSTSEEFEQRSDLDHFYAHLLRIVLIAASRAPGVPAKRLVGERVHRVLQNLAEGKYSDFSALVRDFKSPPVPVPDDYFESPHRDPFEWLRVEAFPDHARLYKLFAPAPQRFKLISRFGNTWISGPRGSGKSHYLRVLAFYPEVWAQARDDHHLARTLENLNLDFRRSFGVLLASRLGEFKPFTPEAMGEDKFDPETQRYLKHVLVLKIWNHTLLSILGGLGLSKHIDVDDPVLAIPETAQPLLDFLEMKLGPMPVMDQWDIASVLRQCSDVTIAKENGSVAVWQDRTRRTMSGLLEEGALHGFFGALNRTFADLARAKFYVLVDDASDGIMHFEMQKILNSLVRSVQKNHCFKITCDKFMYTLESADDRAIDPRHEVTYVDLGEVSTKYDKRPAVHVAKYMERVIDLRLADGGISSGIRKLLGKSQEPREFLAKLSDPKTASKAYYGGWRIVWSLSHGSVRMLLQLIEHILAESRFKNDAVDAIPLDVQDRAVRAYARRHYRELAMLPDQIEGEPVGAALQNVVSAIGHVSREYLVRYDTGDAKRWHETISIEPLDREPLSPRAERILRELLKYGVLIDDGVTFSRSQIGLSKRYDLNKIFAPAFETTYRVRNHMYLSKTRLEQLLLHPGTFLVRHRTKLDELLLSARARGEQGELPL